MTDGIIKVIDNLAAKFGMVIDWTSSNVVPYLQELADRFIQYEIATSYAYIGIMVALCGVFWILAVSYYRHLKKSEGDDWYGLDGLDEGPYFLVIILHVIAVGLSIAALIVTCVQIFDIIEAKFIPEKTIYDYIQRAMNSNAQ